MRRFPIFVVLVALGAAGYWLVGCSADKDDSAMVSINPERKFRLKVPDSPLSVLPAGSTFDSSRLVAGTLPKEAPVLGAGMVLITDNGFTDLPIRLEPEQPRCPNEDQARADGTRVRSESGSRVKWCYGRSSDGQKLLRMVNGRAYPVLASYPSGWERQRQRSGSLIQAGGAWAVEEITALPEGRSGLLVLGGQTVTLYPQLSPDNPAVVGVKPSSGGYLVGGLDYAQRTIEFASGIRSGGFGTRSAATILRSCGVELAGTIGAAAADDDTSGLGSVLIGQSTRCLISQVGSPIEKVYNAGEWLANGAGQVVGGVRGIADTLRSPYWIEITFPAPAWAASSAENGRIAYRVGYAYSQIYSNDPQGGDERLITDDGAAPSYSPDGGKVVFNKSDGIYIAEADGSGQTQLTDDESDNSAAFSADGEFIAFTRWRGETETEIYTMKADGSDQKPLTDGLEGLESINSPAWNQREMEIAFSASDGDGTSLYTVDFPGGDNLQQVTGEDPGIEHEPDYSPDGKTIAYTGSDDWGGGGDIPTGDIYTIAADGSEQGNPSQLTDSGFSVSPVFSPDGERIAFSSHGYGPDNSIITMDSETGDDRFDVTKKTSHGTVYNPSWARKTAN